MSVEKVSCPNCGAPLEYEIWKGRYKCDYCKSTFRDKKENASNGHRYSGPRPEIKLEDLEEFIAPLENVVNEFEKGFEKVARNVILVIAIVIIVIIFAILGIILF